MARVSVIIPTYNTGRFIRDTLDSVVALEGGDVEIVVVDDGSSDGTADVAASYPGVIVHRQQNAGDSAARKKGLELASGDFVMFLDHDDVLHPQAALVHLEEIEADPTLDMVFGSNLLIDSDGNRIGENIQKRRRFSGVDVVMHTTPSFSQCMYRRSALDRIGGFRAEARASADIDLNLRLLGWRDAGLCHGRMVMSYRYHPGQQTRSPSKLFRQHMTVLDDIMGPGGTLPNPALLRTAHRYWGRYYGRYIPMEILRAGARRDWSRLRLAAGAFAGSLPFSAVGAATFAAEKLGMKRRATA